MTSEEEDLSDIYGYTWFTTLFTIIPTVILVAFFVQFINYIRVRVWGLQTKALLLNKHTTRSGGKNKTTHYHFTAKYALYNDNQYRSYTTTFETKSGFYSQYNLNDVIDIKYLYSTYKDKQQDGAKILYPSNLYLADHAESYCSLFGQIYQMVFVMIVASPFLILFNWMLYSWLGIIGPLINLMNILIAIAWFYFCCCPCCIAGCDGTVPWSEQYRESKENKKRQKCGTVITQQEYNEFQQTVCPDAPTETINVEMETNYAMEVPTDTLKGEDVAPPAYDTTM